MTCTKHFEEMATKSSYLYPVVRKSSLLASTRSSQTSALYPDVGTMRKSLTCPVGTGGDKLYGLRRPATTTTARGGSGETSASASNAVGSGGSAGTSLTLSRRRSSAIAIGAVSAINAGNNPKQKSGNAAFPHAYSDPALSSSLSRRRSSGSLRTGDPSSRNAAGGGSRATNARFSLVQRSGAPAIRDAVAALNRKTDAAHQKDTEESPRANLLQPPPPTAELSALADCSRDPYYRVIVAASGGIKSIVAAMKAFRSDEDAQAAGCAALASVCTKSPSNRAAAAREGAVEVVFAAVATYGDAVVRGGGLDALEALETVEGAMTPENAEKLEALREELEDEDDFDVAAVEAAAGKFAPIPGADVAGANPRRRASYAL